jgi:intraflagellar transport protein 172
MHPHAHSAQVAEIQSEMASGNNAGPATGGGVATDAVIQKARKYEADNDYARAIETYLSLRPGDGNNDTLEQCWEQAANLAMNYQVRVCVCVCVCV